MFVDIPAAAVDPDSGFHAACFRLPVANPPAFKTAWGYRDWKKSSYWHFDKGSYDSYWFPIDFAHAKCWLVFSTNGAWEKTESTTWKSPKKTTKICLPQNTLSPYNMYLLLSCVYFRWKNAFLGSISWKTLVVMAAMKTPSPLVPRRSLTSLAAKCTSWTKVKMSRNQKPLVYHPSISHPKHCSTSRAQSAPEWARPLNWSRVPQAAMSAKLRKSAKKQFCAYGETNSANWSKISGQKILRSRSNHCLKNFETWAQLLKQPAHKQWDSMMI